MNATDTMGPGRSAPSRIPDGAARNQCGFIGAAQRATRFGIRLLLFAAVVLTGPFIGPPSAARAQDLQTLQRRNAPLVLDSVGSFFVGGHPAKKTEAELGILSGGPVAVDQMYGQYMVPRKPSGPAIVMIHGATLTGKSYETTPDGRMGWYEYFARKGFPSYVVDQVGRGRSGFDQSAFNDVRAGISDPKTQPNLRRIASDLAWVRWRLGPANGVMFDDAQFPASGAAQLTNQGVPDLEPTPASNEANYAGLVELAGHLKGSVLIGHSQAGRFPFQAALRGASGIRGLVAIEPVGCTAADFSADEIAKLAQSPILVIFGDHLDSPQPIGPAWLPSLRDCEAFVGRVNAAGGKATMMHLPDLGIAGNSHMLMQDRNNLQVADLIIKWIEKNSR